MAALTVRCLTSLATPQKNWLREQKPTRLPIADCRFGSSPAVSSFCLRNQLEIGIRKSAMSWLRRRDSNSYHLVYKTSALKPIELRRNLVDWEGVKPSQEVCRTSMLSVTSPARKSGGCGWSRATNLSLMRRMLCRLSYTAISQLRVQALACCFQFKTI